MNFITDIEKYPLSVIAGPCVMESEQHAYDMAGILAEHADRNMYNFCFKASWDKANRSSFSGYRGDFIIDEANYIFGEIALKYACYVTTDIHLPEHAKIMKNVDIIQIPAFLCRQTDLLVAAAQSRKLVNVKKGQFLAPWDMKNVVEKLEDANAKGILLTERGSCFGYNNLVVDFRSIPIMKDFGHTVVFDATHSVQLPGGQGASSGGQREFVEHLAKAAIMVGADVLFLEVHNDPDNAPCDGPNMLNIKQYKELVEELIRIKETI